MGGMAMKKNNYLPAVLCTLCTVACVLRTCIDVIEKPDEKSSFPFLANLFCGIFWGAESILNFKKCNSQKV